MDVRDVEPGEAARVLAGLARRDASGMLSEDQIPGLCARAKCVRVSTDRGSAVLAMFKRDDVLWIEGVQADGPSVRLTDALDEVLSRSGARSIAFMTERQGLMRLAVEKGYRVAGYVMKKEL